jgi:hypothetical protein
MLQNITAIQKKLISENSEIQEMLQISDIQPNSK